MSSKGPFRSEGRGFKKCRQWNSAEDFGSKKVFKDTRRNPRFPHNTMLKGYKINTPRPIGQCQANSTLPCCLETKYDEFTDEVADMHPWERLRNTFGNKSLPSSLVQPPLAGDSVRLDKSTGSSGTSVDKKSVSSTAVQVNMFHCADCRNHIKYGKEPLLYTSGNEGDSESSGFSSDSCSKGNTQIGKEFCPVASLNSISVENSASDPPPPKTPLPNEKPKTEDIIFSSSKEKFLCRKSQLLTGIIFVILLSISYIFFEDMKVGFNSVIPINLDHLNVRAHFNEMNYETWSDIFKIIYSTENKPFFLDIFEMFYKK